MTYPKRYQLLDKNGKFLGIGVRFHKWQRLKWSLPFVEGARWIAGGRKTRLIKSFKIGELYKALKAAGFEEPREEE
jgi:hypothetical protein